MEKLLSRIACSCCGEFISKPVFVDGKPYGSYCAKKITGKLQAGKTTISFKVVASDFLFHTVIFNNKKYKLPVNPKCKDVDVYHFVIDYKKQNTCQLTKAIIEQAVMASDGRGSTIFDMIAAYIGDL